MTTLLTKQSALHKLRTILNEAEDALAGHDSCKADDDQYEDPEEWWLRPLVTNLKKTIADAESV